MKINRKLDGKRIARWPCKDCRASYNVLAKTLFQGTHISLQKWFLAISLIMNAKKSLYSHQLARDLGLNQKTAWYMQVHIRAEMTSQSSVLPQSIVAVDETYIGGKPRK